MKITNKEINSWSKEIFSEAKEYFKSLDSFKDRFNNIKDDFSLESLGYCIEKFVKSELDISTPGNRGLGRASDFCPRLGAQYRTQLSSLSSSKSKELELLITKLITKCYLVSVIFSSNPVEKDGIDKDSLFERWVPQIYITDLGAIGEDMVNAFFAIIETDWNKITEFLKDGDPDKLTEILKGYFTAGITLRAVEREV